jgi:hypothetical protein
MQIRADTAGGAYTISHYAANHVQENLTLIFKL